MPDFLKTFRTLFGQRRARPAVARDKAPKTARLRGKLRRKIACLHPWKRVGIATHLFLCLIEEPAQLWARSFVPDKSFPLRVAGQFRKQAGMCRNNLSRSDEGNVRIASSISRAVLINAYDTAGDRAGKGDRQRAQSIRRSSTRASTPPRLKQKSRRGPAPAGRHGGFPNLTFLPSSFYFLLSYYPIPRESSVG